MQRGDNRDLELVEQIEDVHTVGPAIDAELVLDGHDVVARPVQPIRNAEVVCRPVRSEAYPDFGREVAFLVVDRDDVDAC